jgi:hypothetical protein
LFECGLDAIRGTDRKQKKCIKHIDPNRKERHTLEDLVADDVKRHLKEVELGCMDPMFQNNGLNLL